jgi:NAD dependent epimerase/dehydratase family
MFALTLVIGTAVFTDHDIIHVYTSKLGEAHVDLETRILITGGVGFIGSHLCERLLAQRAWDLICVDNFFTGTRRNIEHLLDCVIADCEGVVMVGIATIGAGRRRGHAGLANLPQSIEGSAKECN